MPHIKTERLKLVTFKSELMEAFLTKHPDLIQLVPYEIAPGYPLDVYKQFFPYKIERFKNFPEENEWEGLIILKRTNTIIGDMGFKGGPNDAGEINLGYSIVPEYEGHGYATEMGKALCCWAISLPNVQSIVATCDLDNAASKRVLEKVGFKVTHQTDRKYHWSYAGIY